MFKTSGTLHIFGGGEFVGIAEKIANELGWSVVIRTGDRFSKSIPALNLRTKLLVGDDLLALMREGGIPERGDYGISFSAPWIFSQEVIDFFDGDLFNLHNQPLPKFRGGGGASWLILMDEKLGGCCIHRLVRRIDAGDIYARRDFYFPEHFKYPIDFNSYVIDYAKDMLGEWLRKLLMERSPGNVIDIDESESEYWPRINTEIHGWVDWSWSLTDILKFCNAFSYPHPGASTIVNGCVLAIKEVSISSNRKFHPYQNGMIFRISGGLYVAHHDGILHISNYELSDPQVKIKLGDRLFTPKNILEKAMLQRVQYLPSGKVVGLR